MRSFTKHLLFVAAFLFSISNISHAQSNALDFNGVNQTAGTGSQMSGVGTNFTMEFWVNPHTTTTLHGEQSSGINGTANAPEYAVYPLQGGSNGGVGVAVGTNGIVVYGHGDGFLPSLASKAVTISGWTHVAIVVSSNTPNIYVNGNLVHTGLQAPRTLIPSMSLGGGGFGYFDGQIDEFRVWSYAKSAADVEVNHFRTNLRPDENGLRTYYSMDEGSGTSIDDLAINNLNGTTNAAWVTGVYAENDRGLDFDGVDDYVAITNDAAQNLSAGSEGTYEIMLKTTNAGSSYRGLIVRQFGIGMFLKDNQLIAFDWSNGAENATGIFLNDGSWHHVAFTFKIGEANGSHVYVDGNLVKTYTQNVSNGANATVVGAGDPAGASQHFAGQLDEAKIWNVRRTQAQIQSTIGAQILGTESGLLVGYRFQSVSGNLAYDETMGNRWGALQANMTDADWVNTTIPTVGNNSVNFDGISEYFTGTNNSLPVGNSSFTIEAWIKPDVMQNLTIARWGGTTTGQANAFRLSSTGLLHYWWGNDFAVTTGNLSGSWHHVAATWDGTTRKIYLDGILICSQTPIAPNVQSGNFYVGAAGPGSETFDGNVDELRIWNTARSQSEIQNSMSTSFISGTSNLVANYNMDGTNNVLVDYSGNGNNLGGSGIDGSNWVASSTFTPGPEYVKPIFESSSPSINSVAETAFNLFVDVNEPSSLHYVVVPNGESAPNSTQIKAGQKSNGTAALKS